MRSHTRHRGSGPQGSRRATAPPLGLPTGLATRTLWLTRLASRPVIACGGLTPTPPEDPTAPPDAAEAAESLAIVASDDGATLALTGQLDRDTVPTAFERISEALEDRPGGSLGLDLSAVNELDSAGVAMLGALSHRAAELGVTLALGACSDEAREAIDAFPRSSESDQVKPLRSMLAALGGGVVHRLKSFVELIALAADTFYYTFAGAIRTDRVRKGATWAEMLKVGVNALPIVCLIAFLIGVVVGLQSAAQLREFGASMYVANLITISMTREMGPLMTAIIVAGRSGAAIAAEVATMQVTQEVDALSTMGLNPVRYIVVPKFVAMTFALPCLTVFASALGILGGWAMVLLYLDVSTEVYWSRAVQALGLEDVLLGMLKSVAFAWIIVLIAAHRGFKAQEGAESVGRVTTDSVVSSIFWVIMADAAFSLIFYFEG